MLSSGIRISTSPCVVFGSSALRDNLAIGWKNSRKRSSSSTFWMFYPLHLAVTFGNGLVIGFIDMCAVTALLLGDITGGISRTQDVGQCAAILVGRHKAGADADPEEIVVPDETEGLDDGPQGLGQLRCIFNRAAFQQDAELVAPEPGRVSASRSSMRSLIANCSSSSSPAMCPLVSFTTLLLSRSRWHRVCRLSSSAVSRVLTRFVMSSVLCRPRPMVFACTFLMACEAPGMT